MPEPFKDHFSRTAAAYASFRPRYPRDLFALLADRAPGRRLAWDCATGNGQAALGLAEEFERVIATDASAEQIATASPHPRVEYRVARAERSGLPDASVQLLTVAQAAHWLDLPAFYAEAERVLEPRGVIALWCYFLLAIDDAIDEVVLDFYSNVVGPYWPPERAMTEDGYRSLPFPFEEIDLPPVVNEAGMTLEGLAGYLRTWSATQRFVAERHLDPVEPLLLRLGPLWGPPDRRRTARWPLHVRVGRRG